MSKICEPDESHFEHFLKWISELMKAFEHKEEESDIIPGNE